MSCQAYPKFMKPRADTAIPTNVLYVSGFNYTVVENVIDYFSQYGELDFSNGSAVDILVGKRYFFVVYKNESYAEKAFSAINARDRNDDSNKDQRFYVKYAQEFVLPQLPPEPECNSVTEEVVVEGLSLHENFISESEEVNILEELNQGSNQWLSCLSRRVQHFGYSFDYDIKAINPAIPTPPFPKICNSMAEKIQMFHPMTLPLTQLTVNEYEPGQGIAPHIDNLTCFGPEIAILNCGGGIIMTMTDEDRNNLNNNEQPQRKHIWLPRRSLLLLTGASRYRWSHAIAPRMSDKLKDIGIIRRIKRISLTFRNAVIDVSAVIPSSYISPNTIIESSKGIQSTTTNTIASDAITTTTTSTINDNNNDINPRIDNNNNSNRNEFKIPVSDHNNNNNNNINSSKSETNDNKNNNNNNGNGNHSTTTGSLSCPALESQHVHKVYDSIALHWHHSRGKRKVHWHRVKTFLESLPPYSLIADIGCGDGKYLGLNPLLVDIGCDRSIKLLEVSHDITHMTFVCDAVSLPLLSNVFDSVICIALLHHFSTEERRLAVLSELIRIVKPGGCVLIQAWAQEQGPDSNRIFPEQDVLVPWHLQRNFEIETYRDDNSTTTLPTKLHTNKTNGHSNPPQPQPLVDVEPPEVSTKEDVSLEKDEEEEEEEIVPVDELGRRVYQRYCHVYKEGELETLAAKITNCNVIESGWDKSNWVIILQKQ